MVLRRPGHGESPQKISNGKVNSWENRLTTLDMDVRDESAIQRIAETVQDKHGQNLRLLVNVSGVVSSVVVL